jgi:hypothetical protein
MNKPLIARYIDRIQQIISTLSKMQGQPLMIESIALLFECTFLHYSSEEFLKANTEIKIKNVLYKGKN